MLTLKHRLQPPPDLHRAALAVRAMRQPVVIVHQDAPATTARIRDLEAQLATAQRQLAERAHREDRVNAITLRLVDNRAAWLAKTGKGPAPHITITTHHVDVA